MMRLLKFIHKNFLSISFGLFFSKIFTKNKFAPLTILAIFIISALFIGQNLEKPFWGIHDWNGAFFGNIAKNYVSYGYIETQFGQIVNGERTKTEGFDFYTHYGPLLPILISISYKLFGISEWATRLVPLLSTAGVVTVIFLLGNELLGFKFGLGASLFALVTPMLRYFGKNPVHEPVAMFFAMMAIWGAVRIFKRHSLGWPLVYSGIALGMLTNWMAAFVAVGVTLLVWSKKYYMRIAAIWLIVLIMSLWHFLHTYLLTGYFFGGDFIRALLVRTNMVKSATDPSAANLTIFLDRVRLNISDFFTPALMVASLGGVFFWIKDQNLVRFFACLLLLGLGYPFILPNATYLHSYFIFSLSAFLSFSVSYLIFRVAKNNLGWLMMTILLASFVFLGGKSLIIELEESNEDRIAVEAGKEIKRTVPAGERVLFRPSNYGYWIIPHLGYYSDRDILEEGEYEWILSLDYFNEKYSLTKK